MGDRCYLEITVRKQDHAKFKKAFECSQPNVWTARFQQTLRDRPGTLDLMVDEANYAYTNQLDRAAKAGAVFVGIHGNGGNYDSGAFAGIGGHLLEWDTTRDGEFVLRVDDQGDPDPDEQAVFVSYIAHRDKALAVLHKADGLRRYKT